MDKLNLHTPDFTEGNIAKIAELFPSCIVEARDDNGALTRKVDFDQLRQELSDSIVEGPQERYRLDWPGKRESLLTANAPIAKTLRPCREESVDFNTTQNLFIEGDNLDALKLLQETYLGKVKMIYIDPPYNTGHDFIYDDKFQEHSEEFLKRSNQKTDSGERLLANTESNGRFHSDWLSMIYSRLKLSRNLLREDGAIFISIDDSEEQSLRAICDEIFGEDNFVVPIIWQKRITPENRRSFSFEHDYVLCYAKNAEIFREQRNLLPLTVEARARYRNPDNDPRGDWLSVPAIAQAGHATKSQFYKLISPNGREIDPPAGCCWRYSEAKMKTEIGTNSIWFGKDGNGAPRIKRFLTDTRQGLTPSTLWTADAVGSNEQGKKDLSSLFDGQVIFDSPKPPSLIDRILQIATNGTDGEIIMDFFSGSASAAHATMIRNSSDSGNRRHIMIQLPEECASESSAYKAGYNTIAEIGKERIRRAGKKIKEENATTTANLDIGFRVLKIDSSNAKDIYYTPDAINQEELALQVDHIKEDRTAEDLLFQVMLDWGVDLALPIAAESIQGKTVYFVDTNAIAACFDTQINEAFVKELAQREPLRVVFRDTCFESDSAKINVAEIFKLLSPNTDIKTL